VPPPVCHQGRIATLLSRPTQASGRSLLAASATIVLANVFDVDHESYD
jgi:hypothetical protein